MAIAETVLYRLSSLLNIPVNATLGLYPVNAATDKTTPDTGLLAAATDAERYDAAIVQDNLTGHGCRHQSPADDIHGFALGIQKVDVIGRCNTKIGSATASGIWIRWYMRAEIDDVGDRQCPSNDLFVRCKWQVEAIGAGCVPIQGYRCQRLQANGFYRWTCVRCWAIGLGNVKPRSKRRLVDHGEEVVLHAQGRTVVPQWLLAVPGANENNQLVAVGDFYDIRAVEKLAIGVADRRI